MAGYQYLNDLFRHMKWADAAVWRAVEKTPGAESDSKIKTLLNHIHLVQQVYLKIWRGDTAELPKPTDSGTLASIKQAGSDYYGKLPVYLNGLKSSALEATVDIPWGKRLEAKIGRPLAPMTLAESMMQVPMHSGYHRGQINARIRELGGDPPIVDFIAWVWLGKPDGEW